MLILNPNPCFSRTLLVKHFERGAVMRAPSAEVRAGGKGVDSARVAHSLSRKAPLIALVGDRDADEYCRLFFDEKLDFRYTTHSGYVRVATMYIEEVSRNTTIVNEEGASISSQDWENYLDAISIEIKPGEIVLCMGSFPHGVNQASIKALVDLVHQKQSLILFDTAPHFLSYALLAGADIVSPNLDEAEAVINSSSEDFFTGDITDGKNRAMKASPQLHQMGAEIAIVHAGALGSAMTYGAKTIFLSSPIVKVVSTVGAGDSLAAGFALKSEEQGDVRDFDAINWEQSLEFGLAAAANSCERGRSGEIEPDRVHEIFLQVGRVGLEPTTTEL